MIPSILCHGEDLTYSMNGLQTPSGFHQSSDMRRSYLFIKWRGLKTPLGLLQSAAIEEILPIH